MGFCLNQVDPWILILLYQMGWVGLGGNYGSLLHNSMF